MEEAITAILLAASDLGAGDRIHWVRRPQSESEFPAVVLTRVSGRDDYATDGPVGLKQSRLQIDVYAATYAGGKAVARAIKAVLSGYRGTSAGTVIQGIFCLNERDLGDADPGGANPLIRISTDYEIWHD